MTTKRAIREALVDDLGLGFINLRATGGADNVTIDIADIRDILGSTDNRLLEGSYILLKSNIDVAMTNAATLTTTLSDTTGTAVSVTQAGGSTVKVGDVMEINNVEYVVVTDITSTTDTVTACTVERGVLGTTASTATAGDAITIVAYGQWRSISAHSFATDDVTVTRDYFFEVGTPQLLVDFYFILTPAEINNAIDLALSKIWYRDTFAITLVTTENEYDLTSSGSWLKDPSQLIDMSYRFISDDALTTTYTPCVNRRLLSDTDNLTVTLYDRPSDNVNTTLFVTGRRWYEATADDDATITAPLPLIRAAAKVEVLTKIFNKLGKSAKENFGMELTLTERELETMKARYRQAITPTNLIQDEQIEPIVVPVSWRDEGNWW